MFEQKDNKHLERVKLKTLMEQLKNVLKMSIDSLKPVMKNRLGKKTQTNFKELFIIIIISSTAE